MQTHGAFPFIREIILFLALAGVMIPLLARLRINPVLGFLAIGTLLGPYGLVSLSAQWPWLASVTFARHEDVRVLAELGVVFLMFMIGLEMSVNRLWAMRRLVFGMGGLQVGLTALVIGLLASLFGNRVEASVILGLALAFSSTAVVMQLLNQRRVLGSPLGQASFAILLFQDLAVIPLLVLVSILGMGTSGGSFFAVLGTAVLEGVLTVLVIYVVGRRVVRPLFHQIAANRQPDTFMALTLLATLGVAALTWSVGLSMALGALLAGLIIAETEFRHQVEVTIEPFRGLLMGLFFLSVGMGIDTRELLASPVWLPLSVIGLLLIKGVIILGLLRLFGLSWARALEGGLLLSQGGEFAFVVIGLALSFGLLPREVGQFMLIVVGLSMLAAPLVAHVGLRLGDWLAQRSAVQQPVDQVASNHLEGHVIVAGYGRVGHLMGQLLQSQGMPFVAIEQDAGVLERHRDDRARVVFGDASHPELLSRLHLASARAVVLTMDDPAATLRTVLAIRRLAPGLHITARARDARHARSVMDAGATLVVPEALESSLTLADAVLQATGVAPEVRAGLIETERQRSLAAMSDVS